MHENMPKSKHSTGQPTRNEKSRNSHFTIFLCPEENRRYISDDKSVHYEADIIIIANVY